MAHSSEFDSIVAEAFMDTEFFSGASEERREKFRDLFDRLESTLLKSGQKGERLSWLWEKIESDEIAWDEKNPFTSMKVDYPIIHGMVISYRSMHTRSQGPMNKIRKFWGDKAEEFEIFGYHLVKHVAPCAQFRTHAWCMTKIQEIISERVQNRRKGVSKSPNQQNRDWEKLWNIIQAEISQATIPSETPSPANTTAQEQQARLDQEEQARREIEQRVRQEEERLLQEKEDQARLAQEERVREEEVERERLAEEERVRQEEVERERLAEEERVRQEELELERLAEEERVRQEEVERERLAEEQRVRQERRSKKRRGKNNAGKTRKRVKTIDCSCSEFPDGPCEAWKKDLKKVQKLEYDVDKSLWLLSGIAWVDFNACPDHLRAVEKALNMIPQSTITQVKNNLKKFWKGRFDIQEFINNKADMFYG